MELFGQFLNLILLQRKKSGAGLDCSTSTLLGKVCAFFCIYIYKIAPLKHFILEKLIFFIKAFELKFTLNNLKNVKYEFGIHFMELLTKHVFTSQKT